MRRATRFFLSHRRAWRDVLLRELRGSSPQVRVGAHANHLKPFSLAGVSWGVVGLTCLTTPNSLLLKIGAELKGAIKSISQAFFQKPMTTTEMNQLRPDNKIVYEVAHTKTKGTVKSVWRDDRVQIKWQDGTLDSLMIDAESASHLTLVPLGRPRG